MIFFLEKDFFFIDLFFVDVKNGKIIWKVVSVSCEGYIDDFNYIEFLGIWFFNSKEFVFVGVSKGDNVLIIKEVVIGKMVKEIRFKGLFVFSNFVWFLDKKSIVVMGLVNG